ncbi:c-type cytochrome [Chitinophaga filiformis]|uniref:c-type cytochrome n=1 Tax=Chitinophaga filiformis TaxID=104663 RepID=UPI001F39F322|nr:c-type cytochrome [Chitinophaga filiformis]MCF6406451.1 c-type cytochrome [Chitinophaga filiformis]
MNKKTILRILATVVLLVVLVAISGYSYLRFALPNVGAAPDITIERTPARIARGSYLVNHVAGCTDCHSQRDFSKLAGPVLPDSRGAGGVRFDQSFGFPGVFYSKNITPYGLSKWSDGEIYRAITSGVDRHGKTLFPVMPYTSYGKMQTEDVYAIIAYLRTLPAVPNDVPASSADFPVSLLMNLTPADPQPVAHVDRADTVGYGRYLVMTAGCADCHTYKVQGKDSGDAFAGGTAFPLPGGGMSRAANLTPDKETGLGSWTAEQFVARFKAFTDSATRNQPVAKGGFNTMMPWAYYSGMDTSDLRSIYTYLKTLKPVHHQVAKFTP